MGTSAAFAEAVTRVRAGDAAGAEAVLRQALRAVRERSGASSAACANAHYELASFFQATGRLRDAVDPFREACAIDARDEEGRRSRLTYLVQFGELLAQIGELEEAERVLRDSLAGRAAFYGKEHAGYGFGLEPLADVLLRRGAIDEARARCDEAWKIFAANGHERIATALALRAEIAKVVDRASPGFLRMEAEDGLFEALLRAVFDRDPVDLAAWSDVLQEAHALALTRFGTGNALTIDALSHIANHEARRGDGCDHQRRRRALAELVAFFDGRRDARQGILARLGLALAESDAGDGDGALLTYEAARAAAKELGEPGLRATVLRNMGLQLASQGQRELAEKKLRAALKFAKEANDPREVQGARVALGIFLQHGGQLDEARGFLRRALGTGDPTHPDVLCARSHLDAIEQRGSCGCGDMAGSVGATLLAMVRAELADPDLIARVEVDPSGQGNISAHLSREPKGDELEVVQGAVRRAEAKLREGIKRGGSISLNLPGKGN
jgi:tetratricopeptide (TPR) repeat protein